MIELKNVTLVCVACIRTERAINALKYSMKGINFGNVKFFTHEDVKDEIFETVKIDKLSYNDYNKFIVFDLHKYISTDYVLIIQDDGFIVFPESWRDDFLEYDYIGAPWPPKINFFSDKNGCLVRVGNGGFTLRSKKLLKLASDLNLKWTNVSEDYYICCYNSHIYKNNGLKFAPVDIAKYFSHEFDTEETKGIQPFGFHSIRQKYYNLI